MKLTDAPPSTQSIKTPASASICASLTVCRRRTDHADWAHRREGVSDAITTA